MMQVRDAKPPAGMKPIEHLIIRASAGTGKTYSLSNRYLALLRRGVLPEAILATTFTRKAAGEILARVLGRLAHAAGDAKEAAALGKAIGDPALTLADCRAMLKRLCQSLHRVSICTLDSFFNRVVQTFRFELGIPPSPVIVGQEDPLAAQLRLQAIDALLADGKAQVLVDLLRRLHYDSAKRSVTSAIDDLTGLLYEVYRQAPGPECWSCLKVPDGALAAPALAEAIAALRHLAPTLPRGKRWANIWASSREAAEMRDWSGFCGNTLVGKIATGEATYDRADIPPAWRDVYLPLIAHARAELIGAVARQTQATFSLLESFDVHFRRLRLQQRVLLFSDLGHQLAHELPALGENVSADVYYRLDTQVAHLLLDEFQDTSIEQWQVLSPFAREIASQGPAEESGRSIFCVGDRKQAIYAWRGGCAEIFDQIEIDLELGESHRDFLKTSYRSAPVIIETVNTVFQDIASNPALAALTEHACRWTDGFEEHEAKHKDRVGYVELATSPIAESNGGTAEGSEGDDDETDGDYGENGQTTIKPHERYVAQRVVEIARAARGRSIGVLVATNDRVGPLIHLIRGYGENASGEGGSSIIDDPAVGVIAAAVTLSDHPGDRIAAFHVAHSPLAEIVGLTSTELPPVSAVAAAIRRRLLTEGYATVLTDWARRLSPACSARSAHRLTQLVELADRYERDVTLRPHHFVEFLASTVVEEPAPAAIRVMTVHKAKGLEFDVVVLPQLHRRLGHVAPGGVYLYRPEPTAAISAVYRACNKSLRGLSPQLEEAFQQETGRRICDDLSALYVAMTRPRYALHMIVPPLKAKKDGSPYTAGWADPTAAAILRRSLCGDAAPCFDEEKVVYTAGDPQWHRHAGPAPAAPAPSGREIQLHVQLAKATEPARRSWAQISPSALESGGKVRASELLALDASTSKLRGRVIHAWFELVEYLDESSPDSTDERLAAAARMELRADEIGVAGGATWLKELTAQFRKMVQQPGVRTALARPEGASAELWRERPFAVRLADKLVTGVFDRAVVYRQAGRPARAELWDFKTDRAAARANQVAELVERYRPQVEAYRAALAAMLGIKVGAVKARLLFVETGVCREI